MLKDWMNIGALLETARQKYDFSAHQLPPRQDRLPTNAYIWGITIGDDAECFTRDFLVEPGELNFIGASEALTHQIVFDGSTGANHEIDDQHFPYFPCFWTGPESRAG